MDCVNASIYSQHDVYDKISLKDEQTLIARYLAMSVCSSLREILVTCTLFEGGGDNAVSLVCGVDVFEEAAHPGVSADVWIGRCCATKGAKYVHNGSVATNIIGEVLIDRLRK